MPRARSAPTPLSARELVAATALSASSGWRWGSFSSPLPPACFACATDRGGEAAATAPSDRRRGGRGLAVERRRVRALDLPGPWVVLVEWPRPQPEQRGRKRDDGGRETGDLPQDRHQAEALQGPVARGQQRTIPD